jgi:hypothetical protein
MTPSLHYELIIRSRHGHERVEHGYASDRPLREGDLVTLRGDRWIIDRVEQSTGTGQPRAIAEPARYRLDLHYEDGSEDPGAFRRFRTNGPGLGHAFTTLVEGEPVSWQVTDERLARDDNGHPYVEFVAERDYGEFDELPNHELEHLGENVDLAGVAAGVISRAREPGARMELVALDAGAEPDWDDAQRYVSALILEEFGDDLLELCGVEFAHDPREAWAAKALERLRSDLELFRGDVEGDHDEIEEWDSGGTRIFASVGRWEDETAPDKGHGWMVRLVDASALGAAGFHRVRKVDL